MTGRFFRPLHHRWARGLLVVALLGAMIWIVGPLVSVAGITPLHSQQARLIAILMLAFGWGVDNLRVRAKGMKSASAAAPLRDDFAGAKVKEVASGADGQENQLIERLRESIKLLGGASFTGRKKLYQIPWYIIIGAPGSGKTAVVQNAGLQFPLANHIGPEAIQGAETACHWWFADQAVMIDPAGRYISQDDPSGRNSRAWLTFLAALRRARPRQPLDGIIVTVSVTDLLGVAPEQPAHLALALKGRLQELNGQLCMELPIYLLITQCDRVAGFSEFFADLEQTAREQPWGIPLALTAPGTIRDYLAKFSAQYRALLATAKDRLYVRLKRESDPQRRRLLFDFPQQMLGLDERLQTLLRDIFMPNRFEQPMLLRGVYFVSALQSAAPAQFASGVLPTALCKSAVNVGREASRSYFLHRLLSQLVFGEAGLAKFSGAAQRRHRWVLGGALAACLLVFAGLMTAIHSAYRSNSEYVQAIESALAELDASHPESPAEPLGDLLDRLDTLRTLADSSEVTSNGGAWRWFGLDQREKLRAQARHIYVETLSRSLMPVAAAMSAAEVRATMDGGDDSLFEALRTYLLLFRQDRRDSGALVSWAEEGAPRQFGSSGQAPQDARFAHHFRAALEEKLIAPVQDEPLIAEARVRLASVPIARRVYKRLMQALKEKSRGEVSLESLLGSQAQELFVLRSGRPLAQGVPDFFTYRVFHTEVRPQAYLYVEAAAHDDWVLGIEPGSSSGARDLLVEEVLSLYLQEYVVAWRAFLNDIAIRRFHNVREGQRVIQRLAAGDEPLIQLLSAVRTHTQLDAPPPTDQVAAVVTRAMATRQPRLQNALAQAELPQALLPGKAVTDAFRDLNRFVDPAEGLGLRRLQEALAAVATHMDQLALAQFGSDRSIASGAEDRKAVATLRSALVAAPAIVQGWFQVIPQAIEQVSVQGAVGEINAVWQRDVMPFYDRSIKDRYPLNAEAKVEIRLEDFAAFFGPGGIVDRFVADHVARYVDVTGPEWRTRRPIGLKSRSLRLLQRLKQVQEIWFATEATPRVGFALRPRELDATVAQAIVDVGGQALQYGHGPVRQSALYWPGEPGLPARLSFHRVGDNAPVSVHEDGAWAWFRLLDQYARISEEHATGNLILAFSVHGLNVSYELKPESSRHPFTPASLRGLALPLRL